MNERCRTCIHCDGCYDNDTMEGRSCDHYRNKKPQPMNFDWDCLKKTREGNNEKNEQ